MKPRIVISTVLLAVAAIAVLLANRVWAQADSSSVQLQRFEAIGYRPNSSLPLVLQGELIGNNAVWHPVVGPILSNTFAMIPGGGDGFTGAGCRAEYSQDEIVTQDGSTLTVNVYGTRCEPYQPPATSTAASSRVHTKIAAYSVVSGTGKFQNVCAGVGAVAFDTAADGSTSITINGGIVRMRTE
jgi:hypothetical protein